MNQGLQPPLPSAKNSRASANTGGVLVDVDKPYLHYRNNLRLVTHSHWVTLRQMIFHTIPGKERAEHFRTGNHHSRFTVGWLFSPLKLSESARILYSNTEFGTVLKFQVCKYFATMYVSICTICIYGNEGIGSAGAGVTGSGELPGAGTKLQAPVFCEITSTVTAEPSSGPTARLSDCRQRHTTSQWGLTFPLSCP